MMKQNSQQRAMALLVIDLQKGLFEKSTPIYKAKQVLENINTLLDRARQAGVSVFFIQHSDKRVLVRGSDAWRLHPEIQPQPSAMIAKESSMHSIQEDVEELKRQLEKGSIQKAYRALLTYMMELRTCFVNKYGDSAVSGLYQGYMDMTYFALFPSSLKQLDLKIAIVFNYAAFKFEAWLAARNRKVQRQYWELFKDSHWDEYRVVAPAAGIDSILEYDLAKDFEISHPDVLTSRIETATSTFIDDLERFLSKHPIREDVTSGR